MDKKSYNTLIIMFIGTTIITAATILIGVNKMTALNRENIEHNKDNITKIESRVWDLEKECVTREILELSLKQKTN